MEEYISKEQFYRLAHIRKATALRLIQSGLVPAIDTGKPTNRYQIPWKAVEFYLKDRDENPEKYRLVHGCHTQTYPGKYKKSVGQNIRKAAFLLWLDVPDILTSAEVAGLTGYRIETVRTWAKREWITRFRSINQYYHPKKSVIAFVGSKEFHEIRMKSDKHLELIRRATHEGEQDI